MEVFIITKLDFIHYNEIVICWHPTYEDALEEKKVLSKTKPYCDYTIKAVNKGHVRPKNRPPGVPDTREDGQD